MLTFLIAANDRGFVNSHRPAIRARAPRDHYPEEGGMGENYKARGHVSLASLVTAREGRIFTMERTGTNRTDSEHL